MASLVEQKKRLHNFSWWSCHAVDANYTAWEQKMLEHFAARAQKIDRISHTDNRTTERKTKNLPQILSRIYLLLADKYEWSQFSHKFSHFFAVWVEHFDFPYLISFFPHLLQQSQLTIHQHKEMFIFINDEPEKTLLLFAIETDSSWCGCFLLKKYSLSIRVTAFEICWGRKWICREKKIATANIGLDK